MFDRNTGQRKLSDEHGYVQLKRRLFSRILMVARPASSQKLACRKRWPRGGA